MADVRELGKARASPGRDFKKVLYGLGLLCLLTLDARAYSNPSYLDINVSIKGIAAINNVTATPGVSSGTIDLTWTEPFSAGITLPTVYDIRISSVANISDNAGFDISAPMSSLSPTSYPAPGTGGGKQNIIVTGLTPGVTYYFAIREDDSGVPVSSGAWVRNVPANWNVHNYAIAKQILLSSVTVTDIDAYPILRSIKIDWTNPNPKPQDAVILRGLSPMPTSFGLVDYTAYPVGTLINGATVVFNGAGNTFIDSHLALATTYYYELFATNPVPVYSLGVSTSAGLFMRPMPPSGVDRSYPGSTSLKPAALAPPATVTLNWYATVAGEDGTPLNSAADPCVLVGYTVYRSTDIWSPPDSPVVNLSSSTLTWTDSSTGGIDHYYHVTGIDSCNTTSQDSLVIDGTTGELYKPSQGQYLLHISRAGVSTLNSNNAVVFETNHPEELADRIYESVQFTPTRADNGIQMPQSFGLGSPDVEVRFYYTMNGSQPTFLAQSAKPKQAGDTYGPSDLGIFWYNGVTWFKMYGVVDTMGDSIYADVAAFGKFQVRSLQRTQDVTFDPSTITNRFITPNGDGRNDKAFFLLGNPACVQISGKIFDLKSMFVSNMKVESYCTGSTDILSWDGKSNGQVVPGGVYIYQLEAGDKNFNGTVVVIR